MSISIKITNTSEAEELSQIQKAAFKPLYEKFHDAGNPFLRGSEDILRRLNKSYRHFTILLDGKIIGGIFYRLCGKRVPGYEMGGGDYYLQRVYIHPDYQNKGIAREAILLVKKSLLMRNSITLTSRKSWKRTANAIRVPVTATQENESSWRAHRLWQCSKRQ